MLVMIDTEKECRKHSLQHGKCKRKQNHYWTVSIQDSIAASAVHCSWLQGCADAKLSSSLGDKSPTLVDNWHGQTPRDRHATLVDPVLCWSQKPVT